MSTLITILIFILGVFLYLFTYWKRLNEDYSRSIVFASGLSILIGTLIGGGIGTLLSQKISDSRVFYTEGLWFWGAFLGSFISFLFTVRKYKLRFFETFEAMEIGLLLWLTIIFLSTSLPAFVMGMFLVCLYILLNNYYKEFPWYKSGRVGFSGLVVLGSGFLMRFAVALFFPTMISFIGRVDAILSAAVAFLLFFTVHNLSQN